MNKNKPKISIITVSYNSEATIEETIKSIINQGYNNFEYLIIDGGSKDNTMSLVYKYRDNIDMIVSEPDKGISDAFNKGIQKSTGEIIGIINSDDLLLPNALQVIADSYEEDIDVYRGNLIYWNVQTEEKSRTVPTMNFSVYSMRHKRVSHPSTFIRKDAYERYGVYRINYRFSMDADLLTRFYEKGARMKYINADLAVFRQGGVTDRYSYWEKRKEIYGVVANNGGSKIWALLITTKFVVSQFFKKILFRF